MSSPMASVQNLPPSLHPSPRCHIRFTCGCRWTPSPTPHDRTTSPCPHSQTEPPLLPFPSPPSNSTVLVKTPATPPHPKDTIDIMTGHVVIRLRPGSDGDASQVPSGGTLTEVNPPTLYLEKTAQAWMQARGEARKGVKYILESLPAGYTMWQRPRPGNPTHVDKYLYGHPQGRKFDSPNRFFPHFQHLMENAGDSFGCPCTVCAGSSGILPGSRTGTSSTASSRPSTSQGSVPVAAPAPIPVSVQTNQSQAPAACPKTSQTVPLPVGAQSKGRPKLVSAGADSTRVDEEGTPDVYRNLIDKLRRHGHVDEAIEESLSPDWLAEQSMMPTLLQALKEQEQWVPRVGDIVLYVRELPEGLELVRDDAGHIQLYNVDAKDFVGAPDWEAGLVGEAPAEPALIKNLDINHPGADNVIYSGVRVEPLPDPNSDNKSFSKRHRYVALRQTRPFGLWKELLHHIPQADWDATVLHALTIMSTLSLMGRYRFRGNWPSADIYCHGIYLGAELLVVGDAVRLLPNTRNGQTASSDILVIQTIRLKLSNIDKASTNDYDEGRPYNSEVWIYGSAYTSETSRCNKEWLTHENADPSETARSYGEWYPLHPADKELAVPFSRILGRLHEHAAMMAWLSCEPDDSMDLDTGREGLLDARDFARQHDQRIFMEPGATWFWGDSRAESLNVQTINGLEIAKFDQEREIRDLRKNIKVIKGLEVRDGDATKRVAADGTGLRRFMAPGIAALPDRTQISSAGSVDGSSTGTTSSGPAKKRPHILDLSDDDNDEEIRQSTKIIEQAPGLEKKARVMVVID